MNKNNFSETPLLSNASKEKTENAIKYIIEYWTDINKGNKLSDSLKAYKNGNENLINY